MEADIGELDAIGDVGLGRHTRHITEHGTKQRHADSSVLGGDFGIGKDVRGMTKVADRLAPLLGYMWKDEREKPLDSAGERTATTVRSTRSLFLPISLHPRPPPSWDRGLLPCLDPIPPADLQTLKRSGKPGSLGHLWCLRVETMIV